MIQQSGKIMVVISLALLLGCGGNLTDEQRRQMREKMEINRIVRVTDVDITEAAFAKGRALVSTLEGLGSDSIRTDSFVNRQAGRVRFIQPGEPDLEDLEKQLLEAYLAGESGAMEDNVQVKRKANGEYDSLLYTKPVAKKSVDGGTHLVGVWTIWLPKKELVLEITRKK